MSGDLPHEAGIAGPGDRVGRYVLERQIGRGGMATVFAARDEQLGRLVALKVLAAPLAADERFRQRFIRESRAAAAVDDPHIIPLFEAGQAGDVLFIAMRYVPGGDVRSLLGQEGPLEVDRAAAIVSAVASALDAAHAAGLVHRDVKPANMLRDARPGRPEHVYLSDFGLTKDTVGSSGLTGTGLFLGTVDYAAPEQIDGRPVDGRADQYALACAAYEMLTGQPPFPRDQPMAVLAAHLNQQPPPVTSGRPGLALALDAVFARALAKSPEQRYRTCGEFSDALRRAVGLGAYDGGRRDNHRPTQHAWDGPESAPGQATIDAASPGDGQPAPADTAGTSTIPHAPAGPAGWTEPRPARRCPARWLIPVGAAAIAATVAAVAFLAPGKPGSTGPTTSPPSSATPSASWSPYHDPSGFSVSLPAGWTRTASTPGQVKFTGTPPGFVIVIAWSHQPQPDALADWRQQAAAKAAADPTYQQIRVQRVTYRDYNAADWEFTNIYQGQLTHVIDRTLIVQPGRLAYAIELYGPATRWQPTYTTIWPRLLTTFRPAG